VKGAGLEKVCLDHIFSVYLSYIYLAYIDRSLSDDAAKS